jgi:hypothetical protein
MTVSTDICQVLKAAIQRTPLFNNFDHDAIYIGGLPVGIKSAFSVNGTYSIQGKTRQRGATLHLWLPLASPEDETGIIEDMAEALVLSLNGTAIFPTTWIRQPETAHGIDHVVFPVVVYLDLL